MFLRKRLNKPKNWKHNLTYQMCESYRVGNKVRQRVLCSLGDFNNPEQAIAKFSADLERYQHLLNHTLEKRVSKYGENAKGKLILEYSKKVASLEDNLRKIRNVVSQMSVRHDNCALHPPKQQQKNSDELCPGVVG